MGPTKRVVVERLLFPHDLKGLSHPFDFGGQFIEIGQKVKHHAPFDPVWPLTFHATGNPYDIVRDATHPCNAADIDLGSVTVIDGGGNHLNHSFP
jgi:hypothetical protein